LRSSPDPPTGPAEPPRHRNPFQYLQTVLVAVLLACFVRTFLVQAFKIPSTSMEDNLLVGDHLLVNKFVYGPVVSPWERKLLPLRRPARGDVVVFRWPKDPRQDFIKRCVAVAGDTVRIVDKQLRVNRHPVDDSAYVQHVDDRVYPDLPFLDDTYRRRDNFGPLTVPTGHLFVLGDNRDLSNDSRFWGPVSRDLLAGRALGIYWSLAPRRSASVPGEVTGGPLATVRGILGRVRWKRTLRLVR
jgi:signal peptidase I